MYYPSKIDVKLIYPSILRLYKTSTDVPLHNKAIGFSKETAEAESCEVITPPKIWLRMSWLADRLTKFHFLLQHIMVQSLH